MSADLIWLLRTEWIGRAFLLAALLLAAFLLAAVLLAALLQPETSLLKEATV